MAEAEEVAEAGLVCDCKPVLGVNAVDAKAACWNTLVLTADNACRMLPKKASANVGH